jgi:hypothetical protein
VVPAKPVAVYRTDPGFQNVRSEIDVLGRWAKPTLALRSPPTQPPKSGALVALRCRGHGQEFRDNGFIQGAIDDDLDMFTVLDKRLLFKHYVTDKPPLGRVYIEDFAKTFAAACRG